MTILILSLNSLDIELSLSSLLGFLGWWGNVGDAKDLSALGHTQLRLHLIDMSHGFRNGLIIEVDVIIRLRPDSHHLNFVFTLTLYDLLFRVWIVSSSHLSGIWWKEVLVSTLSRSHIDLRVSSWEINSILISFLLHGDAGVLIVSTNWERLLLVIRRLLHRLYFDAKSIWQKSGVIIPVEVVWGNWWLDEGFDESALIWALECVGSMKLKWLTSLMLRFLSHLLVIDDGQLIDIVWNHLHWLNFNVHWLELVVVSEADIALGNFDYGSIIVESLLLCWWNAVVCDLFDLHSGEACSLNLNWFNCY